MATNKGPTEDSGRDSATATGDTTHTAHPATTATTATTTTPGVDVAANHGDNDSLAEEAVGTFTHRRYPPPPSGGGGADAREQVSHLHHGLSSTGGAVASDAAAKKDPTSTAVVVAVAEPAAAVVDPLTKWQSIRANKNVFRVLCFCFLDGGAFSIWNMNVFSVLVEKLGSNTDVGWTSAVSGVSQMIAAALVGFIGENLLRQSLLRLAAFIGLIGVLLTMFGVYSLSLTVLYVSQLFWGCYSGIVATATEAIFADSVATGRRAFIYNVKWMDQTMSSVIGTFIALVILVSQGNTWAQTSVVNTMYGGLLLHPVAMLVLFTLRDRYSLREEEEDEDGFERGRQSAAAACGGDEPLRELDGGRGVKRAKVAEVYTAAASDDTPSPTTSEDPARYDAVMRSQSLNSAASGWGSGLRNSSSHQRLNQHSSDEEEDEGHAGEAAADRSTHMEDRRKPDDEELREVGSAAMMSPSHAHSVLATVDRSGNGHAAAGDAASSTSSTGTEPMAEVRTERQRQEEGSTRKRSKTVRFQVPAEAATKEEKNAGGSVSSMTMGASSSSACSGQPPSGCGEKALIRYLNHQAMRENETFHSEQANLAGQPWQQLVHRLRYYMHLSLTWEAVPFYVCLVDFLVAFGSGMTMRFLPLYFIKDKNTSPALLMTANLLICPVQAIFSHMVQLVGTRCTGRLASTILFRLAGTLLMLIMGLTDLPLWVLLPIFICRNALMNSTRGVTRSVIMDAVKKANRAKWSAFESFSSFTWAGSATIGGYIAKAHGYQYSFTVTAFFHFCALAVLVPATIGSYPVEKEMMREAQERRTAKRAGKARGGTSAAVAATEVTVEAH